MWPCTANYPICTPNEIDSRSYDYVVVGAGCVLASRLSENPEISVLVLERGPINDNWLSQIPIVSSNILRADGGASSWLCEPMKFCNNRRSLFFCGELMGGGSRILLVIAWYTPVGVRQTLTHGLPLVIPSKQLKSLLILALDASLYPVFIKRLAILRIQLVCGANARSIRWIYEKVLPYFVKGEKALDQPKSDYRGHSGPWITRTFRYASWLFRVYRTFTDIAEAMGFLRVPDTNAPDAPSDGVVTFDSTVDEKNQRLSTFDAFLPKELALERKGNLTICPMTLVTKIIFAKESGKGLRAEQVFFKSVDQEAEKVFPVNVKREVVIASGSAGSPQVLMMSGIGPRDHLEDIGVPVVYDLPGVESELTDHVSVPVAWEVPLKESLAQLAVSPVMKGGLEFIKYLISGSGILGMPVQTLSLFVRSSSLSNDGTKLLTRSSESEAPKNSKRSSTYVPQDTIADIEIMPLAVSSMDNLEEHNRLYSKIGVFSMLATLLQPRSRGTVRLRSSNPHDRPKIDFGLLSDPGDIITARTAVRLSLKIGRDMKASGFPLLRNLTFNEEDKDNDAALDEFIKERVRTTYHYACSCRMAPENDPIPGVVDDELRVHGLSNVRVCDTSVFPQITSAHLQAPAAMVSERCADFIKNAL
ncbi:hypothetical protein HYALB_00012512 [Hymenoscyphus albidus]|uniref:Glucose-methanol-choline oxidoreductase N-terminal domain-containing protein n=1 Tax=Hymenoscyphus albidus TaxID=595503 RepID=A0A9N9LSL6_9HELO|nr:hypothetical protein HYALB_00012512 [Hymenoscyphus albidus]